MIEPTGYTALDLVGYTDKGTYAANVNYVKNDLVHYGGNIWRILIDDTIGITPAEGTNYTLFIGEPTNLVERIIAPLEDNPATVAYQTGRQIIYNDYLYEVIQNIAIGDILIAYEDDPTNANIKLASPVETQVLALDGRLDAAEDDIDALETAVAKCECLILSTGNTQVSALPYDFTNSAIETDMVCINSVLGNPSAQVSEEWEVNTDTAGRARVSGTISGSTTITLYLMKSR